MSEARTSDLRCAICTKTWDEHKTVITHDFKHDPRPSNLVARLDRIRARAHSLSAITCAGCSDWTHPLCWIASELDAVLSGMRTDETSELSAANGVIYDRLGWVCSICHGWNHAGDKLCTHTHMMPPEEPTEHTLPECQNLRCRATGKCIGTKPCTLVRPPEKAFGEQSKCAIDKTCLEYPRCRCGGVNGSAEQT